MMKMKTLTAFVIFCIVIVIIYIITDIVIQWKTGEALDPTLTSATVGFFGTELAVSGFIRIFKIRKGE